MNGDGYVIGGAWTSNPMHLSNISDLAKRNRVHICGQTGFCGHIADKIERRNMEENEKWKPNPTRENIFINYDTVLLYRKTEAVSYLRIQQEMTEHQELECFRRDNRFVRLTSRPEGKMRG